jgi:hypothetical protein
MAKKISSAGRRKLRRGMSLNQSVQRKRSRSPGSKKLAYKPEEVDPLSAAEAASEPGAIAGVDLPGLANDFARTLDKYARAFSASGRQQIATTPLMFAPEQSGSLARNGIQAINRELLNHFIEQLHRIFQAMSAIVGTRSPQEMIKVQLDLAKANMESAMQAASCILNVVVQMTTEAIRLNQLARSQLPNLQGFR